MVTSIADVTSTVPSERNSYSYGCHGIISGRRLPVSRIHLPVSGGADALQARSANSVDVASRIAMERFTRCSSRCRSSERSFPISNRRRCYHLNKDAARLSCDACGMAKKTELILKNVRTALRLRADGQPALNPDFSLV